jgi:hypothetical protein
MRIFRVPDHNKPTVELIGVAHCAGRELICAGSINLFHEDRTIWKAPVER